MDPKPPVHKFMSFHRECRYITLILGISNVNECIHGVDDRRRANEPKEERELMSLRKMRAETHGEMIRAEDG